MKTNSTELDTIINSMMKLNSLNGERRNVLAFIQSCYCGRVRDYDFHRAVTSLDKLTPDEQNTLIAYSMRVC